MEAFTVALLLLLGFAVVIVTMSMKWVPQGSNYTVEKFGKYIRTLRPAWVSFFPSLPASGQR